MPFQSSPRLKRTISLKLLDDDDDDDAYDASMEASRMSRAQFTAARPKEFQDRSIYHPADEIKTARTVDGRTDKSVSTIDFITPPRHDSNPFKTQCRRIDLTITSIKPTKTTTANYPAAESNIMHPPELLGTLTSTAVSYTNVEISLTRRMTSWGRGLGCTVNYPDKMDTRIPKHTLKIMFWAPGIEKWAAKGKDWWKMGGVHTIIATSARKCIWVNGVKLKAASQNGDAALYGKIYTGDVVKIWQGRDGSELSLVVDVQYGDSARFRPAAEAGFQILEERHFHQQEMKKRKRMR